MFKTSCVLVRMDFAYNKYPRQRGLSSHVTDIPEAGLRALSSTSECQSSGSALVPHGSCGVAEWLS